jgi:hypothetical protein
VFCPLRLPRRWRCDARSKDRVGDRRESGIETCQQIPHAAIRTKQCKHAALQASLLTNLSLSYLAISDSRSPYEDSPAQVDWRALHPQALAHTRVSKREVGPRRKRPLGGALAENRLDVSAYRCVGVVGRNRKNHPRPSSLLCPVVTRKVLSLTLSHRFCSFDGLKGIGPSQAGPRPAVEGALQTCPQFACLRDSLSCYRRSRSLQRAQPLS